MVRKGFAALDKEIKRCTKAYRDIEWQRAEREIDREEMKDLVEMARAEQVYQRERNREAKRFAMPDPACEAAMKSHPFFNGEPGPPGTEHLWGDYYHEEQE